ncbi:hypothetical protein BWQ96_02040 [Gracilariopsis chorda]|uniref:GOLD domain-containing protein n=1 Tax=Gracilariopsis chorda TaxID=448386 RepID=A0A2V3J137_9FLOR|nr:hypothetical protein BWQ96_02040 [Gracilariopsis chorda]|eukprot:PXF48088.1 hypothetical protein BWQ96_02040 [Gracilariopsis chorda]
MPMQISLRLILLTSFILKANALQFILQAKSRKCFREDVPLSTETLLTYTVAQGLGEMPVSLSVRDITGKSILDRQAIDHGVFTFRSPDEIPTIDQKSDWSLRDDYDGTGDDAYFRAIPGGAGDDRIPYYFCFEHSSSMRFPTFHISGRPHQRRIIFSIRSGTDAKTLEYYDKLAKEKHLTSTEEAFNIVEDRVSEIVRLVDEMRERELRLDHLNRRTQRVVTTYSIITCICVAIGAIYASFATFKHLARQKVI